LSGSERLVRLGKTTKVSEGVGAELVKDSGNEFGELLGLASAGDGEGVGTEGALDWGSVNIQVSSRQRGPFSQSRWREEGEWMDSRKPLSL
jgi:hypothetical protein